MRARILPDGRVAVSVTMVMTVREAAAWGRTLTDFGVGRGDGPESSLAGAEAAP